MISPDSESHGRKSSDAGSSESQTAQVQETPLPKLQLFLLLYIQLAEPLTATVIYPFVNQLVRQTGVTGGDERKTGYYAGLIESAFYAVEAICTLQWGRLSDHIGRKPVFLGGLLGLSLSMLGFGMARQYWALVLARCAAGLLNGNMGVSKSMMTEITDITNRARGFAFLPMTWAIGATIGPIIGGVFSRPADRWPAFRGSRFWTNYPYFLPCVLAACFSLSAFFLAFLLLKETTPRRIHTAHDSQSALPADMEKHPNAAQDLCTDVHQSVGGVPTKDDVGPDPHDSPAGAVGLRSVLIPQVLWPVLSYGFAAFADQCVSVLVPLVYSTNIPLGGLGFSSFTIGLIQGIAGFIAGTIQIIAFPWMLRKVGAKRLYIVSYALFLVIFALFPLISFVTKRAGGVGAATWTLIVIQFVFYVFTYTAFGCIFMYVSDSAPSQQALGTTNGVAQTTASLVRAMAPSFSSSLYSVSLEKNIASGTLVFWILCAITIGGLLATRKLPPRLRANGQEI